MSNILQITVQFLDPEPAFHGKRDGGEPEWPPSPMRLFQALVDAAANRWRDLQFEEYAKPVLKFLEGMSLEIVAPSHLVGTPFRIAVPNNDLDIWAGAISKGNEPKKQPNELKTMKTIQPCRIRIGDGKHGDSLHYLYPVPELSPEKRQEFVNVIGAAARSITHLGWGVDMVAANATIISITDAAALVGHRWLPVESGGTPLRIPVEGTLSILCRKHEQFLNRLKSGYAPSPIPATAFRIQQYHSATASTTAPPSRPWIAFEIHKTLDDLENGDMGSSRFRPFNAARKTLHVAGMLRHSAGKVAEQLGLDAKELVFGHGDEKDGQSTSDRRFWFLPLPSIQYRGEAGTSVTAIRRAIIVGPPAYDFTRFRQRLHGSELIDENTCKPAAMLSFLPPRDKQLQDYYVGTSRTWSTVTPVVLPGFDDPDGLRRKLRSKPDAAEQKRLLEKLDARIVALLVKAFVQAGWPVDLVRKATFEYRNVGFRAGLELAKNYTADWPFPRLHVKVTFPSTISGPLAIGAGRYRGFGVFAISE